MHNKVRTNVTSVSWNFCSDISFRMAPRGILVDFFFFPAVPSAVIKKKPPLQNRQIYSLWENLCSAIKSLKAILELGIKMPQWVELEPVKQVVGRYKLSNTFELFCAMNLQRLWTKWHHSTFGYKSTVSLNTTSKAETSAIQGQLNFWWSALCKHSLNTVKIILLQSVLSTCRSENWTSHIFNTPVSLQFLGSSSRICQRAKAWE